MRSSQWVTTTLISLLRGGGFLMRLSVVATCLSVCLIGFSSAQDAHASIRKETNIPAEGLGPALNGLAKDRNFQIVYVTEEIANVRTEGAVGDFTTEEALKRLLTGTGLTYRSLADKTVTILSRESSRAGVSSRSDQTPSDQRSEAIPPQEGKRSSSEDFRVAQVDEGKGSSTSSVGNLTPNSHENSNSPSAGLSEIIVTAQKRNESIMDVPASITAISGERLADLQVSSLSDLANYVPGMSVTSGGAPGYRLIEIRGLSTNYYPTSGPLVGTYIDDLPVGDSTNSSRGALFGLDLNPYDIEHVEVLKGPQGTLYGANTMGGLIKYSLRSPDLH